MFGLMDGDGGGDQRRRSFLMLDDLVVLGLQQRLRMKRRGRRQVMLRQSRLRLQLDVHVGGLRFGMMMLRQVMVGRDVLNLDLMNLLGLMVNFGPQPEIGSPLFCRTLIAARKAHRIVLVDGAIVEEE